MFRYEKQVYILLTSWPTFDRSPQVMGTVEESVVEVFSTDGCGAMTTGDWVAVVTKAWEGTNKQHLLIIYKYLQEALMICHLNKCIKRECSNVWFQLSSVNAEINYSILSDLKRKFR